MPQEAMDYMVSTLVLLLNQHLWCHTCSCFKKSRATLQDTCCRYQFPRDRVAKTVFTSAGVELSRQSTHEFINGYNYELMATFKCNHDIQVLVGGSDATDRMYYCCKYVTKQQKRVDSSVVVALAALKRRQGKEAGEISVSALDEELSFSFARKRVASVVYAMTNKQEIAGPLAALYLYRGSCCYSSDGCASLPLGEIVRQLCAAEEYSCYLVNTSESVNEPNFRAASFLDDYIYRPDVLKETSLYQFSMRFFRKGDTNAPISRLPFLQQHLLWASHSIGKRHSEVVPVIYGYRMPCVEDGSPLEIKRKRALLSLVLFKPFRDLADLIGEGPPTDKRWVNTYEAWVPQCGAFARTIMGNMDDYYCGANHAKADSVDTSADEPGNFRAQGEKELEEDSDNDSLLDELLSTHIADYLDEDEVNGSYLDIWNNDADTSVIPDTSILNPSICPTAARPDPNIGHIIRTFTGLDLLKGAAVQTASLSSCNTTLDINPTIAQMRDWIADSTTDNSVRTTVPDFTVIRHTTLIELLGDALSEPSMTWEPHDQPYSDQFQVVPDFATISSISQAFTLNEKQHYAVKTIGKALLTRWKNSESLSYLEGELSNKLLMDQLRFFLGGEGGTGKSRVIDAIEKLCSSWGRSDCLVKTALTGKAATLIGGRTLASFLLQLRRSNSVEVPVNLDMVIIDEISMMKKTQLVELDKLLRVAKHIPEVPFGGTSIVLVGDFLQLPPIGADPLYRYPAGKSRYRVNEIAGYQLWRSFRDVIILDQCVRFQQDPEWGNGCHQARRGVWTPEFVRMINSRVMNFDASLRRFLFGNNASPPTFVTPDNSTRLAINNITL